MPFAVGRIIFQSPLTTRKPGDDIEIRQKENETIATLRKTVEGQRQVITQLERKIEDLSQQNKDHVAALGANRVVTPQEQEAYKNQSLLINTLQDERNQLALWLRANKSQEISQGKHAGQELIPLILKYLGGTMPDPSIPLTPTPTPEEGKVQ